MVTWYTSHTNVLNGDLMSDPHEESWSMMSQQHQDGLQNDYTGTYRTVRGTFYKEDGTRSEGVNQAQPDPITLDMVKEYQGAGSLTGITRSLTSFLKNILIYSQPSITVWGEHYEKYRL